jgi:carboxymethylenebutenolidase
MATQSGDALAFRPRHMADNVSLQNPLSRYGKGPGLLLLVPKDYKSRSSTDITKTLDPEPQQKWAEEGFAVVEVKVDPATVEEDCKVGIEALKNLPQCSSYTTVGVIGM